jgi:circadian clock protein KaiB
LKYVAAIANKLGDQYEMEVIDVHQCPQIVQEEKILVTPTLIRYQPLPTKRIVGDLSQIEAALSELTKI